jgi:segregation and condensation protein B
MHIKQLKSALEAILFLQQKPLVLVKLQETIDETLPEDDYRAALAELVQDYQVEDRGIELAEVAGGYLFRTKLEHRDMIRRMHQITPVRMSQAMLKVLSIIAFYQPVTREKLEEIRGVECGHHLRNLMEKRLVRMVGRSDAVGKPMLYGTTKEFLELFGLPSLQEMPKLQEIEEMLPQNEVGVIEDEELRIRSELQTIVANASELEFADIELEEQRLFGEEALEQAEQDFDKASENGGGRETQERTEAPRGKARQAELLTDEVAGSIAFGSPSAEQEREWESDETVSRGADERGTEIAARELLAGVDEEAAPAEDHLSGRDHQPEKS